MLEIIDSSSVLGSKTEIELFSVPPTQVAINHSYWHAVYPKNTVTQQGPYEFQITPDPNYLDLGSNLLHLRLKLTKADGANLAAGDVVGPINAIGKTFFKQIKVWLGSKLAYDSSDTYAYRAYLETLVNYGSDAKETHLETCLFAKDDSASMELANNTGFVARRARSSVSKVLDLLTPIHADVFHQDRLLVSNIDVRVELHRNSDAFCVFGTDDAIVDTKVNVLSMVWYVKKVEVLPSVAIALENTLARTPAMYPLRRMVVKTLHVDGGLRSTPHNLLINGQVPRRIIIGCVDKDAYFGSAKKNPFNFKNFSVSSVQIQAGDQLYPRNAIECNFTTNEYVRVYTSLMDALAVSRADRGVGITFADFKKGYCLFGFMLTPDASDGEHWDLLRSGSTTVKLNFSANTPDEGLELIIWCEFDNLMKIDGDRNCFFDYSI